ncbi:CobW/HypB/UreG, nucleotide-binding domain-containing protein [Cunninghamella echinulata]|nr:CobW/HypB/UreG, nucleotide-binding domain-containing protein [Cunninghamella echinulata]
MKKRGKFDYILLETSGLADPGPIASMFWLDDSLGSEIYLDGIITLVDAKHIQEYMREKKQDVPINEAIKQIAISDRIVINKIDLVTENELNILEEDIKDINSVAETLRTERSRIPLDFVLDIGAYNTNTDTIEKQTNKINTHSRHDAHHISHDVHTICIQFDTQLDTIELLETWIQTLLWERSVPGIDEEENGEITVLRLKGIIQLPKDKQNENKDSDEINRKKHIVIQGVQELYDIQPGLQESDEVDPVNKIVLIGKNLHAEKLLSSFIKWVKLDPSTVRVI